MLLCVLLFQYKIASFSLCVMSLSLLKHVDRRLTALLCAQPLVVAVVGGGGGLLLRTRVIWVECDDAELKEVALDKVNTENIERGFIIPYVEHGSRCDITFEDLNETKNNDNQAVTYMGAQGFNNFHAYSRRAFNQLRENTSGSRFVTDPSTRENLWINGNYAASRLLGVKILNSGWNKWRGFDAPTPVPPPRASDGKVCYPASTGGNDFIDRICVGISVKYYFKLNEFEDSAESKREKLPSRAFLDFAVLMETCPASQQSYTGKCACAIPRVTLADGEEAVIAFIPSGVVAIQAYEGVNWDDHNYVIFTRDAIAAYLYGSAHYMSVTHVQRVDNQNNVYSTDGHTVFECYYFKINDAGSFKVPVYMRLTKFTGGGGNDISWSLKRLESVVEGEFRSGLVGAFVPAGKFY